MMICTREFSARPHLTTPKPHRTFNRGVRAFTLVELLVVVAIIALLLSILLPGMSKIRGVTENVKCLSNLKQLALNVEIYATDYDRNAPPHEQFGPEIEAHQQNVFRLLHNEGYIENDASFVCPTNGAALAGPADNVQFYTPGPENNDNLEGLSSSGYASNRDILGDWNTDHWDSAGSNSLEPPGPYGSYLAWIFIDAGRGGPSEREYRTAYNQTFRLGLISHTGSFAEPERYYSLRHGGFFNIAGSDGSVASFTREEATNNAPPSQNMTDTTGYNIYFDHMRWE